MATREQQVAALQKDWDTNPRWKGVVRNYTADDVVRLRGSLQIEHTIAQRGAEKMWDLLAHRAVRRHARRHDRQPGHAAGQGRPESDLPVGLAGGGRRQRRRRNVSRPVAVPGQLGADGGQAHQQHLPARRPDPVVRRQGRHRLLRADHRRCRSRLRRRAQCVRTDEVDDRCGRRRRPLRRPAGVGQEMRPHGRQGAGADPRIRRKADRRAPGRRRHGHLAPW